MLVTAPATCAIVENMVFPVACKNLSYTVYPIEPSDKQQHILRYTEPISITVPSFEKRDINHLDKNKPKIKNTAYITSARKIPLPAVLFTLSESFSPRLFERQAFIPIPVPTPIAIIIICTGNASVRA